MDLNWEADHIAHLLDFAGHAHVNILISNRNNHSSDQRWVNLCGEENSLIRLNEFLK